MIEIEIPKGMYSRNFIKYVLKLFVSPYYGLISGAEVTATVMKTRLRLASVRMTIKRCVEILLAVIIVFQRFQKNIRSTE